MDGKQISSLCSLLRCEGDKILNSDYKLTLSGDLLQALNHSFLNIESELYSTQSFQVLKPSNSLAEIPRKIEFIYDFVQKTLALCITSFNSGTANDRPVDISKFRSLRKLEINKINIKQITGLQRLRAQLHELICTRCIERIQDVIIECGGDQTEGFAWNELKYANFSYNNLRFIDCALEFGQYIERLNLSHNRIVSAEAIKWLPFLKNINLSFNRLKQVPDFHVDVCKRLKVLILNNNFIEEISSVSRLSSLVKLDLSQNCIMDHAKLYPLGTLNSLCYLSLIENPIFYDPKHRQLTASYLHRNTLNARFAFNEESLSNYEKKFVGTVIHNASTFFRPESSQSIHSRQTQGSVASSLDSVNTEISVKPMTSSTTSKQSKPKTRVITLEEKPNSQPEEESSSKNYQIQLCDTPDQSAIEIGAQIENLRKEYGSNWLHGENLNKLKSVLGIKYDSAEKLNQITSQQILNDILSANTSKNQPSTSFTDETIANMSITFTSTPIDSTKENKFPLEYHAAGSLVSRDTSYHSADESSRAHNETNYVSVDNTKNLEEDNHSLDLIYKNLQGESIISDPEDNEVMYIVYPEGQEMERLVVVSDISIKEKDSITGRTIAKWGLGTLESCDIIRENTLRINFDTVKKDKKERIFVVKEGLCQHLEKFLRKILSERSLNEMNQTVYKCVGCSMQFSRENRFRNKNLEIPCPHCKSTFIVEIKEYPRTLTNAELAEEIFEAPIENKILASGASSSRTEKVARPRSAGTKLNTIEKSSSQSSIDKVYGDSTNNNHLMNIENITNGAWTSTNKTLSSAGSLNGSSSCSKISNSQTSFDSNQSVAGSSTQDRDKDFDFTQMNVESDIEILSNPSQSSIEVLDQAHSSRKASEERRICHVPTLDTIDDSTSMNVCNILPPLNQNEDVSHVNEQITPIDNGIKNEDPAQQNKKKNVFTNLTESSSSGSVTDSVCTAYENSDKSAETARHAEQTAIDEKVASGEITSSTKDLKSDGAQRATEAQSKTSEKTKNDTSLISSMLGGLFQSTNSLLSRSQKVTDSQSQKCDLFEFSYKDYSYADQKLKLYLYQSLFEDKNEFLKWLVKGKIVTNDKKCGCFDGILVASSTKFYILKVVGEQHHDVSKWLKRHACVDIDCLQSFQILPSKIGFTVSGRDLGSYHILLQDGLRTENLWVFFANNPLPEECHIESSPLETLTNKINRIVEGEPKWISVLDSCEVVLDDVKRSHSLSSFISTDSHLYVASSPTDWLTEDINATMATYHSQFMSNLVEIERPAKNIFEINFIDEYNDKCELWKCTFPTEDGANLCFDAIGQSWEALFRTPLESK